MKMEKGGFRTNHLTFGVLTGITISYIIPTFLHISTKSVLPLLIFNLLYVFLTFPLNGKLTKKLCMLLIGNFICIFWNWLFILFTTTAAECFSCSFETFYIIINPFLNIIWLVSFWSISLTILSDSENRSLRQKHVY